MDPYGNGQDANSYQEIDAVEDGTSNLHRESKSRKLPQWVKRLYELGVTDSFCTISVNEVVSPSFTKLAATNCVVPAPSKERPTFLRCTMEIERPVRLKVIGLPSKSKSYAVISAAVLVEEEIIRQTQKSAIHKPPPLHTPLAKSAMNKLFRTVPTSTTFLYPLPHYFTSVAPSDLIPSVPMFLCELTFITSHNKSFASEIGFQDEHSTRIGVLFRSDIKPPKSVSRLRRNTDAVNTTEEPYTAKFEIPALGSEPISVRMGQPHRIDGDSLSTTRLEWAQRFNEMLHSWISHVDGDMTARKAPDDFTGHGRPCSSLDRTYLFVPLSQPTGSSDLNIDWDLLQQIYHQRTKSYLTGVDYNWVLPGVGAVSCSTLSWMFLLIGATGIAPSLSPPWVLAPGILLFLFGQPVSWKLVIAYVCAIITGLEIDIMLAPGATSAIGNHSYKQLQNRDLYFFLTGVGMSFFFEVMELLWPRRRAPFDLLRHRFLTERIPLSSFLYVYSGTGVNEYNTTHLTRKIQSGLKTASSTETLENVEQNLASYVSPSERRNCQWKINMRLTTANEKEGPVETPMTSKSKLLGFSGAIVTNVKRRFYERKFGFKMSAETTFVQCYQAKCLNVRYRSEPLLPVYVYQRSPGCETSVAKDTTYPDSHTMVHVVPEFVEVLPMPRDIFYICQFASRFMEPLERAIELRHLEARLQDLAGNAASRLTTLSSSDKYIHPRCVRAQNDDQMFSSLIFDAVVLTPCHSYHRLQFFGITVLQFFTCINLFSRNSDLKWNVDDLEEYKSFALKKSTLCNAALQCSINRVVVKNQRRWHTAYCHTSYKREETFSDHHHSAEIADGVLGKIVEALMGAIFFGGLQVRSFMAIGFLDELKLPLPGARLRTDDQMPWFTARGACICEGYPFKIDRKWFKEVVNLGTIIYCNHEIADSLEKGRLKLLDIIFNISSSSLENGLLKSDLSKILLLISLFDDSLGYEEDSYSKGTGSLTGSLTGSTSNTDDEEEVVGLVRVALMRDNLFVIGDAALNLCLSEDIFRLFAETTAGDMHLLRTCILSDDALAYVMVKNGIHDCLFDSESEFTAKFCQEVSAADALQVNTWNERGGWILEDGIDEFRRRWENSFVPTGRQERQLFKPRYKGLVGGRLRGHQEKLPKELTEDLAYSMKAIVGAMVLCLGLEGMWRCVSPLYKELLLLSPSEIREEYREFSSLCGSHEEDSDESD